MANISDRIRKVRKDNGISQVDFAASIGVTQGFVSGLEKGRYQPTADTIICISNKYKVNANWLLAGEEKEKQDFVGDPRPDYGHKLSVKDRIDLHLDKMDEEAQKDVLKYIQQAECYAEHLKKEKKRG